MKRFFPRALLLLALAATPLLGMAQSSRAELVQRIAAAQGLDRIFEAQLAQQRDAILAFGQDAFDKLAPPGSAAAADPKARAAFERYARRSATLFTGEEYLAVWARGYGASALTEDDLKAILAYYESPAGKKDGAASQIAMQGFTTWLLQQSEARANASVDQLRKELREMQP